ncbi:hypothetical protein E4U43_004970 [Claviceps pusilla]|uniref:Zn(2)-C6 fungal-type domain-containing protein n=1 Tax=Claviceps pusilla TaxID=123648 RepID=A0A9P7N526_9HYPO|nr:hypothetical protein E4U43_004970 [Claviceps pusilla]
MNLAVSATAADEATRKRVATACEACRATKIRCQPSVQPGICKKHPHEAAPPGSSSIFSIDFAVQTRTEVDEGFGLLRDTHEQIMSKLFPEEESNEAGDGASSLSGPTFSGTPASSSTQSQSLYDRHTKPLFNLASAESLLLSFRSMLRHFPFMTLPRDTSIQHFAATKPFVLLAILSSASGSKTLQGHSLYDEEFRKVLGLKFVAEGERSMELLQGLLIYCAWYPFHLRPKNKQAYQYMRMAAELICDLGLDQEQYLGSLSGDSARPTDEQLGGIRTYLGLTYLVSMFLEIGKSKRMPNVPFTPWTAKCCRILELHALTDDDHMLVALGRTAGVAFQASQILEPSHGMLNDDERRIMLAVPLRLQISFMKIYLDGGRLLRAMARAPLPSDIHAWPAMPCSNESLRNCAIGLAALYGDMMSVDSCEFGHFTLAEWSSLILATILGMRLSFQVADCPEFDTQWARSQLKLDEFLAHMSHHRQPNPPDSNSSSGKADVLSASSMVMSLVRDKYHARLRTLETTSSPCPQHVIRCPMLDGSMDPYLPLWNASSLALDGRLDLTPASGPDAQSLLPLDDLWMTMTTEWAAN